MDPRLEAFYAADPAWRTLPRWEQRILFRRWADAQGLRLELQFSPRTELARALGQLQMLAVVMVLIHSSTFANWPMVSLIVVLTILPPLIAGISRPVLEERPSVDVRLAPDVRDFELPRSPARRVST